MSIITTLMRAVLAASALAAVPWTAQAQSCPANPTAGADYSNRDLSGCNFSTMNLGAAKFSSSTLLGATFKGASLDGANFSGAKFGRWTAGNGQTTSFTEADLTKADFTGTFLAEVEMQFAKLKCTTFKQTVLSSAKFGPRLRLDDDDACRTSFRNATMNCEFIAQWKSLDLSNANLQACWDKLAGVDFGHAVMNGVQLSGINLAGTRWQSAELNGAMFMKSDLSDADFTGAFLKAALFNQSDLSRVKFDGATLSGAQLIGATLSRASMHGAILQEADGYRAANLTGAFMPSVNLTGAVLSNAVMAGVQFYGQDASLAGATMQNVSLSGANLSGVSLASAQLQGAVFDGAVLVGASLKGANLGPADGVRVTSLNHANLQSADLSGANLTGASLANAAVATGSGVPLFSDGSDTANLVKDLDASRYTAELAKLFASHGYPLFVCNDPQMLVISPDLAWEVTTSTPVGTSPSLYSRFDVTATSSGVKVSGRTSTGPGATLFTVRGDFASDLNARQFPRAVLDGFADNGYKLPPCENPSITVSAKTPPKWDVSEALTTLSQTGAGYTGFSVFQTTDQSALNVFGSVITVVQVDEKGLLSNRPITVTPTIFDSANFSNDTVMPNNQTYKTNKDKNLTLAQMMIAPNPPAPPACVPSPLTWCD